MTCTRGPEDNRFVAPMCNIRIQRLRPCHARPVKVGHPPRSFFLPLRRHHPVDLSPTLPPKHLNARSLQPRNSRERFRGLAGLRLKPRKIAPLQLRTHIPEPLPHSDTHTIRLKSSTLNSPTHRILRPHPQTRSHEPGTMSCPSPSPWPPPGRSSLLFEPELFYVYIHIYIYIHMYICVYTYTYIYIYMYTSF